MKLIKHDQYMISLFILYQRFYPQIYMFYTYMSVVLSIRSMGHRKGRGFGAVNTWRILSLIFNQFYDWNFLELEKDL